jgi:hypothetical protein
MSAWRLAALLKQRVHEITDTVEALTLHSTLITRWPLQLYYPALDRLFGIWREGEILEIIYLQVGFHVIIVRHFFC